MHMGPVIYAQTYTRRLSSAAALCCKCCAHFLYAVKYAAHSPRGEHTESLTITSLHIYITHI